MLTVKNSLIDNFLNLICFVGEITNMITTPIRSTQSPEINPLKILYTDDIVSSAMAQLTSRIEEFETRGSGYQLCRILRISVELIATKEAASA